MAGVILVMALTRLLNQFKSLLCDVILHCYVMLLVTLCHDVVLLCYGTLSYVVKLCCLFMLCHGGVMLW